MAIIFWKIENECGRGCGEIGNHAGVNIKIPQLPCTAIRRFLEMLNTDLILQFYSRVHDPEKWEHTYTRKLAHGCSQEPTSGNDPHVRLWMSMWTNLPAPHSGVLLCLLKEWRTNARCNEDENTRLREGSQTEEVPCWSCIHEVSEQANPWGQEVDSRGERGWGGTENGYGVYVGDEDVPELDSGDGYTTWWVY